MSTIVAALSPPPKMRLEDLEAEREVNISAPLPLLENEICDRYEKVFTAA